MGGQCHIPATLPPGKRPGTHCIGGWVGHRASLDGRENLAPPPGFDPQTFQPVASHYIDYTIPVPWYHMYQQETRLSSFFHHSIMMTSMGEEKDHKPEIIMHYNATKSGVDVLGSL